jgi:hypothetical protein
MNVAQERGTKPNRWTGAVLHWHLLSAKTTYTSKLEEVS